MIRATRRCARDARARRPIPRAASPAIMPPRDLEAATMGGADHPTTRKKRTQTVAWAALLVGAIASFELNYALIPLVALCLAMTNLVGYFKCSKDAQSQLNGFARRQVASALFSGVGSSAS